jgi:Tfp pilus assembly protein PilF
MKGKKKADKPASKSIFAQQNPARPFYFWLLPLLVIITGLLYYPSLDNKLTNWDDNVNITENAVIRTFHGDSIGYTLNKIFVNPESVMYVPITNLTYCLEYAAYKLDPRPYHRTNLILHLLNILLVFYFIRLLTGQQWVAFITAVLFALHPMHVESVSWVAGRVDVLYSFFYLSALCAYLLYLKDGKWKWGYYVLAYVLFIFSLWSKVMAVSLPIVFFAIDYFLGRKLTLKIVWEKAAFILTAFVFGIIAIRLQKYDSNTNSLEYHFVMRALESFYAVFTYLWKLILPINLCCYYDFPVKQDGMYPLGFYIAPVVVLLLAYGVYRSLRFTKDVVFGAALFLIGIALILPVLPVRGTQLAERYTYLSYIGLFFIIARGLNYLWENKQAKIQSFKIPATVVFVVFVLMCCYLSFERTKVWHDDLSLWGDAAEKCQTSATIFRKRGEAYVAQQQLDKAISDFSRSIELKPEIPDAYYNRGICYIQTAKYPDAIKDLDRVVQLNSNFMETYYDRGLAYHLLNRYDEAIKDYTMAIAAMPTNAKAYANRGIVYYNIGKFDKALEDELEAKRLGHPVEDRTIETLQGLVKKPAN